MARIVKISGYFVTKEFDPDEVGADALAMAIEQGAVSGDMYPQQVHVEVSESFELGDGVPELQKNCDLAILEGHFPRRHDNLPADRQIIVDGVYRHFKGHTVRVLAVSRDTEYPTQMCVVYRHTESGEIWHRPLEMFASKVDKSKYPDAGQEYRFELVGVKDWCGR